MERRAPSVVTGLYGTLGLVFFMQEDYWPLNTALYISEFHGTSPAFAAFLLRNAAHEIPLVFPPSNLRDRFDHYALENFRQIRTLEHQSERLKAARDLLLPKLMSGEIEV